MAETLVRVTETYPNPGERKAVVATVDRILNLGGVMRLVLEYGKPLTVHRMVRKGEMPEAPQELLDDDIYAAARNAEMESFVPKTLTGKREALSAFEVLFQAFDVLSKRRLKPKIMLVHQLSELRAWLRVDAYQDVSEVYGVSVRPQKDIPDDCVLLVATTWDDYDTVVFSLRLEMETPKRTP